ncbi:hypothetical protein MNBD_CHLOROFLEXI01-4103 [hydrothermal vent metagenome]|uniref:DJ-1/PfpI domain-containing protein n=1 Tax=hydrothermal vent metagenome TaxID=652676 RepID=A0A3B0VLG0_9ZZZZ
MISTTHATHNNAALLIAPGFSESEVVFCLSKIRSAGFPISLIGLSNNLIHSQHGLAVRPDFSLNQIPHNVSFRLLIIPGSYECVTNLLTSPDFHQQIKKSIEQQGDIAILNEAATALQQAKLFTEQSEYILRQDDQPLESFCQQLLQSKAIT